MWRERLCCVTASSLAGLKAVTASSPAGLKAVAGGAENGARFASVLPWSGGSRLRLHETGGALVSDRAQVARPHREHTEGASPWVPPSQPQQGDPRRVPGPETQGCCTPRGSSASDREDTDSHQPPSLSKHDAILSDSRVTPRRGPKAQFGLKWDFLPAQGHTD